jgi:hypothetical protein
VPVATMFGLTMGPETQPSEHEFDPLELHIKINFLSLNCFCQVFGHSNDKTD